MGGFFGAVSHRDIVLDTFFGVDYHTHLGTHIAGMLFYDREKGFQRHIHNIENAPFRSRFEDDLGESSGNIGIGCISDASPQPLLVKSHLGTYGISITGIINNKEELIKSYIKETGQQFMAMSNGDVNSTELVAALIHQKKDFVSGIKHAQKLVKGSLTILILTENEEIIAARDFYGRLPVLIGKNRDGHCVSFESFAYQKLGYKDVYELGPAEIVKVNADGFEILSERKKKMRMCTFLWSYYGYPNSNYEGINVEVARNKNGEIMARSEIENGTMPEIDYVAGVPDSGVPHAIGYAHASHIQFARPFIKYTPTWPRSFTPDNQKLRKHIAKMKLIPIPELIKGKKLLLVDDSIVRGTQLQETVDFLYDSGAKEVHMRSACPPIMYACKFLNFSRANSDMDLIARRVIHELEGEEGEKHIDEYANPKSERGKCLVKSIAEKLNFQSLGYQSLDELIEAIGIDKDKLCTYCWNGKE